VKAWKAALAAAVASAAIALIVVAPLAQSSKRRGGLKVVTTTSGFGGGQATAKCPRGFVVIGGGFNNPEPGVTTAFKLDQRRWRVTVVGSDKRGVSADAQAICAKGTGGFRVQDEGEADGG
jgi:hypothetical protein